MLTVEDLRHWLIESDGRLFWRKAPNRRIRVGSEAGHWNDDACSHVVGLNGIETTRSRIVWALALGQWPATPLRHRNGDKRDDRLCNLTCPSEQRKAGGRSGITTLFAICQAPRESHFIQNGISHCEKADQGQDHAR